MNWRRGLFRCWVIVSVLWIAGVALVGSENISRVASPVTFYDGTQALEFPGNTSRQSAKHAIVAYLLEKKPSQIDSNETASPHLARVPTAKLQEMLSARLSTRADEIMGQYTPRSYFSTVMGLLAAAIAVPAVLFFGGLAGLWVFRGFKTKP